VKNKKNKKQKLLLSEEEEDLKFKRPMIDEMFYIQPDDSAIIIFDEDVVYQDQEFKQLAPSEVLKLELIEDEDIVIYGYPTQYIITHFKNNLNKLTDNDELFRDENHEYYFRVEDYKPYKK